MSLKKSLKKLGKNLKKAAKVVGRASAKVVKYAAPVVGSVLLGPVGGLAGTALAGAASQVGPNKNRGKALKRTLIYGGAVSAGTAEIGLASGAGAGASLLTSVPRLFGGSPEQPEGMSEGGGGGGTSGLDQAFIDSKRASSSPALDSMLGNAFLGSMFSGADPSRTSDPNEAGERGGGPFGGLFGGEEGTEGGIKPIWIVAGLGAVLLLSKRKAG